MHGRGAPFLVALIAFGLLVVACSPSPPATPTEVSVDEAAFWERFPLPEDAEPVAVADGFDQGFATRMIEPEIFDFCAGWLTQEGWNQQAPTEARVTLPHQRWRKDDTELLIELQPFDHQGRTVVWLRLESLAD